MIASRSPFATSRHRSQMAFAMLAALALQACVQTSGTGGFGGAVKPADDIRVSIGGNAILGMVRLGAAGKALGATGATGLSGHEVYVRSGVVDGRIGGDQGRLAKSAAEAVCREAGGQFNPRAIGSYDGARGWSFPGACA